MEGPAIPSGGGAQASASKAILSPRLTLSTSRYQCNLSVIPIYHYLNLPPANFSVIVFIRLSPTAWFPSTNLRYCFIHIIYLRVIRYLS